MKRMKSPGLLRTVVFAAVPLWLLAASVWPSLALFKAPDAQKAPDAPAEKPISAAHKSVRRPMTMPPESAERFGVYDKLDPQWPYRVLDKSLVLDMRVLPLTQEFYPEWPAWSADGLRLAFNYGECQWKYDTGATLWCCDRLGGHAHPISARAEVKDREYLVPCWGRRDGEETIYAHYWRDEEAPSHLGAFDPDLGVSPDEGPVAVSVGYTFEHPRWRPGQSAGHDEVLYWTNDTGGEGESTEVHHVRLLDLITHTDKQLCKNIHNPGPASWSPDGRFIVLVASDPVATEDHPGTNLVICNVADGSYRRLVTNPWAEFERTIAFSPSGRTVAFENGSGNKGIWIADVKTGKTRQLVFGTFSQLAWSSRDELAASVPGPGNNDSAIVVFKIKPGAL